MTSTRDIPEHARLGSGEQEALVYSPPKLRVLGDLRALTLGGSLGRQDSGAPTQQAIPGGGP